MPCRTCVAPYWAPQAAHLEQLAAGAGGAPALDAAALIARRPQVGAHHVGVALHLGRRAVGDLRPKSSATTLVGDAHHHVHVVLDQQHGQVELGADPAQQLHQRLDLLVVEAARGLVEQQQLGLARERAAELDALLGAERQVDHRPVGDGVELEQRRAGGRPARRAAPPRARTDGRRKALAR